jgi:hypothetical protein
MGLWQSLDGCKKSRPDRVSNIELCGVQRFAKSTEVSQPIYFVTVRVKPFKIFFCQVLYMKRDLKCLSFGSLMIYIKK